MTDRTISSRPSQEQTIAIVDFMVKHPDLAQGHLRGLEGRDQSKKLWSQLTRIVNNLNGPTRPVKSWIKYWADKKSTVRSKVQSCNGDTNNLLSNIETRIWNHFLANDPPKTRKSVKREKEQEMYLEEAYLEDGHEESDVLMFDEPTINPEPEDRQVAIMEKLVKVMGDQAAAMSQLANASSVNSQAMERLAEASQLQARAIDRLATTFESIGSATHDVRNAMVEIDTTVKRFYSTSPT